MTGDCVIIEKLPIKSDAPSFLIVVLRYIGDVLITTPLAFSIKRAYPNARVEYLVFSGTESCLEKNSFIDRVHTVTRGEKCIGLMFALFRKYDFALAANPSDRSMVYAGLAGRKSLGLLYQRKFLSGLLLDCQLHCDDRKHVVPVVLGLLEPLGIKSIPEVVMESDSSDADFVKVRLPSSGYIILHPYSRAACKYWPAESWGELAAEIIRQTGLAPVFTVTGDPRDGELLKEILVAAPLGTMSLPEPFTFSQLAAAIKMSRAYVGIDTVVTHIAASTGTKVIALFGPTLTRYWAPWSNGCLDESPFSQGKGIQRLGNITVMQKNWTCVPCNKETCAISRREKMECLEALSVDEVCTEIINYLRSKSYGNT